MGLPMVELPARLMAPQMNNDFNSRPNSTIYYCMPPRRIFIMIYNDYICIVVGCEEFVQHIVVSNKQRLSVLIQ